MYLGGQPVILLREGTERTTGRDAQKSNLMAAIAIADTVKSSLGPKGQDKLLIDSTGDLTVTNDGATILKELEVAHPVGKFLVDLAKTQDSEVGDGTTSVVIIAGELLRRANDLIDQNIHPSIIVDGYAKAYQKSLEILDKISKVITLNDTQYLLQIAQTAMSSKLIAGSKNILAPIAVNAIRTIYDQERKIADIDLIKVEKKKGKSIAETELIRGVVLDKDFVHPKMEKVIKNARIALIDCALEIEKTEITAKIHITAPDQMQRFKDQEYSMLQRMADLVKASGCNVIFTQKGIDDNVQNMLAKDGIAAVRRVKKSDMEKLSLATNAKIITKLEHLTSDTLGKSGKVEEKMVGDDKMVFVTECATPKSATILIRGGSELVVDETERAMHDALCILRTTLRDMKIIPGGGAVEIEITKDLRAWAKEIPNAREKMAVDKFIEAMECIPKILAENGGMDPITKLGEMRTAHDKGQQYMGINLVDSKVDDMSSIGVWESTIAKRQAIHSATEAAQMILRIDDVIAAKDLGKGGGKGKPPKHSEDMDSD